MQPDDKSYYGEEPAMRGLHPMRIFLKLLISPVEGWKALKRCGTDYETVGRKCFYPLTALASVCAFSQMFYYGSSLAETLMKAIIVFTSFFMGYFSIVAGCRIFLPSDVRPMMTGKFARSAIMMAEATLVLFMAIYELIPMLEPILVFLPLYTVYLVVRMVRFLRLPEGRDTVTATVLSVLTIGVPVLFYWLFGELLPQME